MKEKTGRLAAAVEFGATVDVIVNVAVGVVEALVVVFLVQALAKTQRLGLLVVDSNGLSSNMAVVNGRVVDVVTIEFDE